MVSVVYIGQDENFFQSIKKRMEEEYHSEEFTFNRVFQEDLMTFQKLTLKVFDFKPDIVFLDYSKHPEKVLTLARTLPKIFPHTNAFIGLWDYLSPKDLIFEGNITGVPISHIKSGEIGDVVFHAMYLHQKGAPSLRNWAKAEVIENLDLEISQQMKVGFMTEEYIHVEHDIYPPQDDAFRLNCHFFKGFDVEGFKVLRNIDENFYYHFNFSSDLSLIYHKQIPPKPKETKQQTVWREKEMRDIEDRRRESVQQYINTYKTKDKPKRTRLLVIDPELSIIRQADRPLDHYDYSIRVYSSIGKTGVVLKKVKPGIICYQCPKGSEGELPEIMNQLELFTGYKPFVVVFRSKWSSEHLQGHFQYDRVIAHKDEFSLIQLLDFCQIYEEHEGREKSHDSQMSYHDKEARVYFDKTTPESYVEYPVQVHLREFCESWIKFQCREKLPKWSIYKLSWPCEMALTVVEEHDEKDWKISGDYRQYTAIVHCVGEKDKANLRRTINQTIFDERKKKEEAQKQKK